MLAIVGVPAARGKLCPLEPGLTLPQRPHPPRSEPARQATVTVKASGQLHGVLLPGCYDVALALCRTVPSTPACLRSTPAALEILLHTVACS